MHNETERSSGRKKTETKTLAKHTHTHNTTAAKPTKRAKQAQAGEQARDSQCF
jgi:hypothetical protein